MSTASSLGGGASKTDGAASECQQQLIWAEVHPILMHSIPAPTLFLAFECE